MAGHDRMHATSMVSAKRRLEAFPLFRNMGVRVIALDHDWRLVRIRLPLAAQNLNPGGTMFGGAVAALADPIPALACHSIFPGYAVWTRELGVDFRKPGIADLELRFEFDAEIERRIRRELQTIGRSTPCFEFGFYLPDGDLSSWVSNRVAIRPGSSESDQARGPRD